MKAKHYLFTPVAAAVLGLCTMANGQEEKQKEKQNQPASTMNTQSADQAIDSWPEGPKKVAKQMIEKHGAPDGVAPDRLIWSNPPAPFAEIIVFSEPVQHSWPKEHQDFLEHAVLLEVPAEKVGELAKFDGSVIVYPTKGRLAARCDKPEANILTLNLAHQIITGETNPEEARKAFVEAMKQASQGSPPDIMKSLQFEPVSKEVANSPDKAVMGE